MNIMAMSSSRPYLIKALYEWIVDNQCTPYVLVNAMAKNVSVPQDHVNADGQVVLNISPSAVMQFSLENGCLSFRARFGGVPTDIFVPCSAVMGIYAKENQQGMVFELDSEPDDTPPPGTNSGNKKKSAVTQLRPSLKVVK
jgi:stringent starvation protein B